MEELRYQHIIENAPFGYAYHRIITDAIGTPVDYEYVEVSQAFEKLTGLKFTEIINRRITEILPDITTGDFNWISYYGEIALNCGEKEFEQYSESLKKWYKVQAFSREKYYFTTIFIDITKEKENAHELEKFFSVNLDLLCIADFKGNFIKVNKEWEYVLGYSVEELQCKNFLEFVHPDDRDDTLSAMLKLSKNEVVLNYTNRYKCKDGTYRFIEWRSRPDGDFIYAAARDITEHKKTISESLEFQEKLLIKNQQLRQIIDLVPSYVYAKDNDGRYLMANQAVADLFKLTPDEVVGKLGRDYGASDGQLKKYLEADKLVIDSGKPLFISEEQILRKDGSLGWFQTTKIPYKHPGCDKPAILGVSTDITERKKHEDKVNQQAAILNGLLDSIPDPIFYKDVNGVYIGCNLSLAALLGRPTEEIIGNTIYDLFTKETADYFCKDDEEIMKQGTIHNEEKWYDYPDGRRARLNTIKSPLYGLDGRILGIIGISRDITSRKLLEEELENNKNQFEKIFTYSPVMKAIIKDNRCIKVNKAWVNNTGYSKDEYELTEVDQSPILKDLSSCLNGLGDVKCGKKEKYIKITYTTKRNKQRFALVACEELRINDSTQILVVAIDITKQQQYEDEIAKLDRLKTIGQVAAAIGHEVRNPLTTIKGFTQLFSIKSEFRPYQTQLQLVIDEIDRANDIISQFLSLARTDKPIMENLSFCKEIIEVLPLINAYALEENVTIKTNFQNVPNVHICKNEFRQVLLNVVNNAIDASEEGGIVTISMYEEDLHVVISITDQGAGIPEDIQDKIGEPFYTTKISGTGLGLAVCNTILHRHSGVMEFKTSNLGTIFYLKFPVG